MQGLNGHETDQDIPGVNWRVFDDDNTPPQVTLNAASLYYEPNEEYTCRIESFDISRDGAGNRTEHILGALALYPDIHFIGADNNPLPNLLKLYDYETIEHAYYQTRDATGDLFKRVNLSSKEMLDLVQGSSEGNKPLSVEGLGILLDKLIFLSQDRPRILANWAVDCIKRSLPYVDGASGGAVYLERVVEALRPADSPFKIFPAPGNTPIVDTLRRLYGPEETPHLLAEAIEWAVDATYNTFESHNVRDEVMNDAQSAARLAAMIVDFQTINARPNPFPASERHWQFQRLYQLMVESNKSARRIR
jgi:hypothetical protein